MTDQFQVTLLCLGILGSLSPNEFQILSFEMNFKFQLTAVGLLRLGSCTALELPSEDREEREREGGSLGCPYELSR